MIFGDTQCLWHWLFFQRNSHRRVQLDKNPGACLQGRSLIFQKIGTRPFTSMIYGYQIQKCPGLLVGERGNNGLLLSIDIGYVVIDVGLLVIVRSPSLPPKCMPYLQEIGRNLGYLQEIGGNLGYFRLNLFDESPSVVDPLQFISIPCIHGRGESCLHKAPWMLL